MGTNVMHSPEAGAGRRQLNVIKVGGAVVEDAASLSQLLGQFASMDGCRVLVHGGGRLATSMAARLGIESRMVGGRRITDDEMLRVVTMVYGGLVNKNIVAGLQARGVRAMGLTGADGDAIRSHRRLPKPVRMDDGTEQTVDFGFVGDVDRVDGLLLARLVADGIVPVVAPLTHDGQGHILNTNADTIASSVAQALAEHFDVTLTFCFEKPGVLRDAANDASVIPVISEQQFPGLVADGIVSGGMLPKLENAFCAIRHGVKQVVITRADDIAGLRGTVVRG